MPTAVPTATETEEAGQISTPEQEIDLRALAKKVYELLKREARIERERGGRRI